MQYAQTKSKEAISSNNNHDKFFEAWQRCPNCEQSYQHQLAFDLANSLLSFVKDKYPKLNTQEEYILVVRALQFKMDKSQTFLSPCISTGYRGRK